MKEDLKIQSHDLQSKINTKLKSEKQLPGFKAFKQLFDSQDLRQRLESQTSIKKVDSLYEMTQFKPNVELVITIL